MTTNTTKTEKALAPLVEAVQGDFTWAADTLDQVIEHLHWLEGLLRHDREAKQVAHGTAEALGTFADGLRKESSEYADRVLPDREAVAPDLKLAKGEAA